MIWTQNRNEEVLGWGFIGNAVGSKEMVGTPNPGPVGTLRFRSSRNIGKFTDRTDNIKSDQLPLPYVAWMIEKVCAGLGIPKDMDNVVIEHPLLEKTVHEFFG